MALGDLAAAEIDARRMLAGTPTEHAIGMGSLAKIDLYWGRFDDGLRGLLASADEFDTAGAPHWASSQRYNAGRHAWWLGDRVTARAAFARVVADHSQRVPMTRVHALIAADKLDDARARAAELPDGSLDRATAELAIASAVHDPAGVLAAFARIEQLSTTIEHLFAAADALERTGRPDDAAAMYERLVNHVYSWQEPIATTRAWSRLGHLREHAGDIAGARAAFAEVIRRWGHATARIPEVDDARRQLRALRGR
jgi:tetratricopeptide (TPR) repeat protein